MKEGVLFWRASNKETHVNIYCEMVLRGQLYSLRRIVSLLDVSASGTDVFCHTITSMERDMSLQKELLR